MASAVAKDLLPEPARRPPALASGDRLSRPEFERRYAAMPDGKKAELIEGVVYMSSPVRHDLHSKPHAILNAWLLYYVAKTSGLQAYGDNGTVRLDNDNEVQPDLYLMLPPQLGGRAIVDADGYISGPPALVCEIAASSVNIDLHAKKTAYRRNSVQEYFVWRTEDAAVDWFTLFEGEFILIAPNGEGILCSKAFPGLCVNPQALLSGDLPALFALLDQTTGTPEHRAFVATLIQASGAPAAGKS